MKWNAEEHADENVGEDDCCSTSYVRLHGIEVVLGHEQKTDWKQNICKGHQENGEIFLSNFVCQPLN